jgi:hypothetical protein
MLMSGARSSWSERPLIPFPDRVALLRAIVQWWSHQDQEKEKSCALTLTGTLSCRRQWSALVTLGVTQVKEIGVVVNPLFGGSLSLCSVHCAALLLHECMGFTFAIVWSGSAPRRAQAPRQSGTATPPCPS